MSQYDRSKVSQTKVNWASVITDQKSFSSDRSLFICVIFFVVVVNVIAPTRNDKSPIFGALFFLRLVFFPKKMMIQCHFTELFKQCCYQQNMFEARMSNQYFLSNKKQTSEEILIGNYNQISLKSQKVENDNSFQFCNP